MSQTLLRGTWGKDKRPLTQVASREIVSRCKKKVTVRMTGYQNRLLKEAVE